MKSRTSIQIRFGNLFQTLMTAVCALAFLSSVQGQEALRMSLAGETTQAFQRQAAATIGYYNLLTGPVAWRFSSGLAMEYDDNVLLAQNAESDLIIRPSVNTMMHWPVTLKNSLDVSLAAGYSEYLQHQDLSQFFINPGSGLSFDVYVGDFKINLHDRIAITEYGYQNPGASGGNQNLESLENTAGASGLWDLGKVIANLGYDHGNYMTLSQGSQNYQPPDAASENIFANAGLRVWPELMLGLEAGGTLFSYNQSGTSNSLVLPNAVQWSAGVFGSEKISDYMDVRVDAGYTGYTPSSTTTNLVLQDNSGFYLSFSLSHRVNRFVNYTLTAGRGTDLSAYGQAQSYYFVSLTPNWNIFKKFSVSTPVSWRQGSWIYNFTGGSAADYDQILVGLNVSRNLTQKLSAGINYQFVQETSNVALLNYTVNIVGLNLSYRF